MVTAYHPPLHVAMVASEAAPFVKSGGLADVVGSLSSALERLGLRLSLIIPAHRSVLEGSFQLEDAGVRFAVPISHRMEPGSLLRTRLGNAISVYLIQADRYFDRAGLYGTADGDYPDNAERFVFFSRAALEVLKADPPDILHAHDWQTALSVASLRADAGRYPELRPTRTVFTVHNAAYQGIFWHLDWHLLNLDARFFSPGYLEYHGGINFLKSGLVFADAITTVSHSYAEEVKTPEQGWGLDGVFRERADSLTGILNGIDQEAWNPRSDLFIASTYGPARLTGKKACKADLQRAFSLPEDPDVLLAGMVSRLASQKGFDLLREALGQLLDRRLQFILLGSGDRRYQDFFSAAAREHPDRIGIRIAFDDALAHRVVAGSDVLLVPSQYEPCGLAQMYALRYGTIPLVRATGGLRDTVQQFDPAGGTGNGFVFGPYRAEALVEAVDRTLSAFDRKTEWTALMKNAMAGDFSWDRSAPAYLRVYQQLSGK
jgi:starch synthase